MSTQTTEGTIPNKPSPIIANHKTTAIGLWLAAFGIFVQAATGATGYPKIPPGIIILVVVGLVVYLTAGRRSVSLIGLLLAGFISVGVFTTHGTGYRLTHPEAIGPFIGTLVQLFGLIVAPVGGVASAVKSYFLSSEGLYKTLSNLANLYRTHWTPVLKSRCSTEERLR
jgi:hypothetical protein